MKQIKIGLIGFGTIGAGVVSALQSKRRFLREKVGFDIVIARICDKDIKTKRPVKIDRKILTKSIGKVLYDPSIDIVVELMGGFYPARDVILESLRQGKHVVTANKALLSECSDEIFGLASELGLSVGFEASVGGGIPIIKSLKEGFVANRIELIYGIINGTSNYILSKMSEDGGTFGEALKTAQDNGYAEKNPSFDIDGMDSCHKLSILAMLGFGTSVRPKDIYTEGIREVEASDLDYAKELGYAIKLLAIAKRNGDKLEMRVHPTLIKRPHLLTNVNGIYNAIFIRGDLVGDNLFIGEGAGAKPTSSAIVSDIAAIAGNMKCAEKCCATARSHKSDPKTVVDMNEIRTRYYIRFSTIDKPGVLAKISGILGKHGISIATVAQKERREARVVPIVMLTHEALELGMQRALKEIGALNIIKKKTVRIRIED